MELSEEAAKRRMFPADVAAKKPSLVRRTRLILSPFTGLSRRASQVPTASPTRIEPSFVPTTILEAGSESQSCEMIQSRREKEGQTYKTTIQVKK